MASKSYCLKGEELEITLKVKVKLDRLIHWEGRLLTKDTINEFIYEDAQKAVVDKIDELIRDEVYDDRHTYYDCFVYEIRSVEDVTDEG